MVKIAFFIGILCKDRLNFNICNLIIISTKTLTIS